MANSRNEGKGLFAGPPVATRYSVKGHPSIQQLTAEQGTGPIIEVRLLHGDFWPEEESVEEFLAAFYEWRGRKKTDHAE